MNQSMKMDSVDLHQHDKGLSSQQNNARAEDINDSNHDMAANETNQNSSPPHAASTGTGDVSGFSLHPCTALKYLYSMVLVILSSAIVMTLIFQNQTKLAQEVHPIAAFVVLCICLVWFCAVEGGEGALVGLVPVPKSLYASTHPIADRCTTLAHAGNNLDRYLTGRQFIVYLLVFASNRCVTPVNRNDAAVWGLPDAFQQIFVQTSLAMVLVTVIVGQLHSQVNASNCMLDFINNRFVLLTIYVSLALEATGICHAVYLLQHCFTKLSAQKVDRIAKNSEDSNDVETGVAATTATTMGEGSPPFTRNLWQQVLFCGRVAFSVALLIFAFAVTLTALFHGQTNTRLTPVVSVILFFGLMLMLGLLEGTQIAVFAVSRMPEEELSHYPKSVLRCVDVLLRRNNGQNVARFMIGRQILSTLLAFVLARVTTVNINDGDDTVWGVPPRLQAFFDTGLLGAIIVTLVASIAWKLLGSSFPVLYLSNPLVYVLIQLCLALEASGVCSSAFPFAAWHRWWSGMQPDTVYIGKTPDLALDAIDDGSVTSDTAKSLNSTCEPSSLSSSGSSSCLDEHAADSLCSSSPEQADNVENSSPPQQHCSKVNNEEAPKEGRRSLSHQIQQRGEDWKLEIASENPCDLESEDGTSGKRFQSNEQI